jgi:prophage regulatory protein
MSRPDSNRPAQASHSERLLRARQIYLERLGVSRSTFYDLVKKGQFPPPVRISAQCVGWRESDVAAFIASRPEVDRPSTQL